MPRSGLRPVARQDLLRSSASLQRLSATVAAPAHAPRAVPNPIAVCLSWGRSPATLALHRAVTARCAFLPMIGEPCPQVSKRRVAIKKIRDVFRDLVDGKRILREIKLLRHLGGHQVRRLARVRCCPPLIWRPWPCCFPRQVQPPLR